MTMDRKKLLDSPERRGVAAVQFELRADASDADTLRLTGYASVFDKAYDVMGGPPWGWRETVDPAAFDRTLSESPDLHLLINHEGMPLARTKSGTLELSTDRRGLLVDARLSRRDPDVQRLETKMARRDMDEMSFAFRVKADQWNADETERRLMEVSLHKGDVSVVNFGANPATSAQLNSLDATLDLLADADAESVAAEMRAGGTVDLQRLARARDNLGAVYRSLMPPSRRTLGLAGYRDVLAGKRALG